jgi:hypothetical protein
VIAFGLCIVGSFLAAAVLGSFRKVKLPRYRRLRGFFMGAGLGGLVALGVTPLTEPMVYPLSSWLDGALTKLGFLKIRSFDHLFYLGRAFCGDRTWCQSWVVADEGEAA